MMCLLARCLSPNISKASSSPRRVFQMDTDPCNACMRDGPHFACVKQGRIGSRAKDSANEKEENTACFVVPVSHPRRILIVDQLSHVVR